MRRILLGVLASAAVVGLDWLARHAPTSELAAGACLLVAVLVLVALVAFLHALDGGRRGVEWGGR